MMDLHHLPRHLPNLFLDPVPFVKGRQKRPTLNGTTTCERKIPLTLATSLAARPNADADPRAPDTGRPAQELQV